MSQEAEVIEFPVQLVETRCGACGVTFAMPVQMVRDRQQTHASFWCPNGHLRCYPAESDIDVIKRLQAHTSLLEAQLKRISEIDVGMFNKSSLELAIEIATNALKK